MIRVFVLTFFSFASVLSLRLEDVGEGSCQGIRPKRLENVDINFLDSVKYLAASNRYTLYFIASGHPYLHEMREFELYYNACISREVRFLAGHGTASGFGGRALVNFTSRPRRRQPGVIDAFSIGPDGPDGSRIQLTVTLTDNETFAFLVVCFTGTDQRGFEVFANTPELSPSVQRTIEQHAISLGFRREDIVFLSDKSCGKDPYPDYKASNDSGVGEKATVKALPGILSVKKATRMSVKDARVPWTSVGSGSSR